MAQDSFHRSASASVPASAGIGLRPEHYRDILERLPRIGWLEVHSENYFGRGGAPRHYLDRIRRDYPVSLHGVGLSLGSTDALNRSHLQQLKDLINCIEPEMVSEHLSWCSFEGVYLNDLVPLPYTQEALDHVASRVATVQDWLGRTILIENPSSYLEFKDSTCTESAFLAELTRRTGCGLLLDINNVYVSCQNHGWDADSYLDEIPADRVAEIHLAGHTVNHWAGGSILIDTHDRPVAEPVWALFRETLARLGPKPTLIEWDAEIPELDVLLEEAARAEAALEIFDECFA